MFFKGFNIFTFAAGIVLGQMIGTLTNATHRPSATWFVAGATLVVWYGWLSVSSRISTRRGGTLTTMKSAPAVAAFNAKMDADPDRIMRLAAANTMRLTGKTCL